MSMVHLGIEAMYWVFGARSAVSVACWSYIDWILGLEQRFLSMVRLHKQTTLYCSVELKVCVVSDLFKKFSKFNEL